MRVLVCVHKVGVVALKEMPPFCHLEELFSFTLNVFFCFSLRLFFFLFVRFLEGDLRCLTQWEGTWWDVYEDTPPSWTQPLPPWTRRKCKKCQWNKRWLETPESFLESRPRLREQCWNLNAQEITELQTSSRSNSHWTVDDAWWDHLERRKQQQQHPWSLLSDCIYKSFLCASTV